MLATGVVTVALIRVRVVHPRILEYSRHTPSLHPRPCHCHHNTWIFLCVLCRTGMLPQPNCSKPARPPRLGRIGGSDTPPPPVVPPSSEGKGPAPGPVATSAPPAVSGPGDAVRVLTELGRPSLGSDVAELSMLFLRLGWSHKDRMRAVGFDPNAGVVTTAAGPCGTMMPVIVQDSRTHRVKVEPKEVLGSSCGTPRSCHA